MRAPTGPRTGLDAGLDAGLAVDRELAAGEPGLPGLALALDPAALRGWAAAAGLDLGPAARVDRLRLKPSTSVRAAVDPGDGGGWWLLAAHSPQSWRKVGKDVRAAVATGRVLVDEERRAVLVPACGDRALPLLRSDFDRPGVRTLAHNPARRAVLRDGDEVVKVHADDVTAGRSARAAAALAATGARTPAVTVRTGRCATSAWVAGTPLTGAGRDGADVAELLARLRTTPVRDLPVLSPADLDAAVVRATTALAALPLPPPVRDRARALAVRWRTWASDPGVGVDAPRSPLPAAGFAHGDLSPDQLLRCPRTGELVVLDLDRAGSAPRGWDAATWLAATTALGRGALLPGPPPHPLLVAAAAAVRAPEPFRRRREGWFDRTLDLLALAETALADPDAGAVDR